jgi:hypothetical protein
MAVVSATKAWELVLILTELKSCLIQFTHAKQRGASFLKNACSEIGVYCE